MSSATSTDAVLRPWQFFLLAGMLAATATVVVATGQTPASIISLSLTVISASLVGLGAFKSLAPLVSPTAAESPALIEGRTRAALEREKILVLRSIKELEFDRAMGKVGQSDFDEMSSRLRSRAIRLMRQLDSGGYREVIERELRGRLETIGSKIDDEVGGRDFSPAVNGATKIAPSCIACDTVNDEDARFCKNCGGKLDRPA